MNYELLEAAEQLLSAIKLGDVDLDGDVDVNDALLALQAAVGKQTLSETAQKAADVDGVEGISVSDALLILQKAVGKISGFPVQQ